MQKGGEVSMTDRDQSSRQMIKTDTDKNILVEAGAGSGKTYELVERMVSMIESGIDISRICAITFTKAAAREFYMRFQYALTQKAAACTDEQLLARYTAALDNIDLCFMGTIDSFSELLLRENSIDAGLPSNFTSGKADDLESVYLTELSKIIAGSYGDELLRKYRVFKQLHDYPPANTVFIEGIKKVSELRHTKVQIPPFDYDLDKHLAPIKAGFMQLFDKLINNPGKAYKGSSGNDTKHTDKLEAFKTQMTKLSGSWSSIINELPDIFKLLDGYYITCPPADLGIMRTNCFKPLSSPKNTYKFDIKLTRIDKLFSDYKYCVTLDFLVSACNEIAKRQKKAGKLTFYEAKLALRDMLKKDAEINSGRLIRHIRGRHSHFLLDEFQDTDPMQSEIFFYLSTDDPDPDWTKCIPAPGSLFIVGDPKQSIYRFRGADTQAFTKVKELFVSTGGEKADLTRNYRSTAHLRERFNMMFGELMQNETTYLSKFYDIPIDDKDDDKIFTGVFSYVTSAVDNAADVAKLINSLVNDKRLLIPDKDTGKLRNIEYGDIMLTFRYKPRMPDYLLALNKAEIPFITEGKSLLDKCPALTSLCRIVSSLADPKDSIAVFSALTCGVFGLTETDILNTRLKMELSFKKKKTDDENAAPEYETPKTGSKRIDDALEVLGELRKVMGGMPTSALCELILNRLDVIGHTGSENLECLYYVLDLLRSAEISGEVIGLGDAAQMLNSKVFSGDEEQTLRLDSRPNAVKVANIHKLKGLEAPIMILADYASSELKPDMRKEFCDDGSSKSYIFKCSVKMPNSQYYRTCFETSAYADKYSEEADASQAEQSKLLYVAATRARCALFTPKPTDGKNNYWGFLTAFADREFGINPDAKGTARPEIGADALDKTVPDISNKSQLAEKSYKITLPSKDHKSKVSKNKDDPAEADTAPVTTVKVRGKDFDPALAGTLIHRLMERVVSAPADYDPDALAKAVLKDIGADESYLDMIKNTYTQLKNGGFDQQGRCDNDILATLTGATDIHCELPFCFKKQNADGTFELIGGVIDLIYRKDGVLYIVDYKTYADTKNIEQRAMPQLDDYKQAVFELTGEKAQAYVYHIDI